MSKIDSKYEAERFAIETQDERDAEYILEVIMQRRRFAPKTRDELAIAISRVRAGHPLRHKRTTGQKRNRA
ncbi:hypothetical protein [Leisingera sp. ANG-M1]|uniref:hypothetical protein n=1 Tax=Leisingera sp. ANG-M1 TaxID=1577895 RepID=UPI000B12A9DB|nr:hypothetical protein [Leisingera sp. ANG-M1]